MSAQEDVTEGGEAVRGRLFGRRSQGRARYQRKPRRYEFPEEDDAFLEAGRMFPSQSSL